VRSMTVEGWRFIAHSYAMVNQWQLLALLRRSDITLKIVDLPYYRKRWAPQYGLFNPADESLLQSLEIAAPDDRADVTLRISAPFDLSPSQSPRTAIFGTSETQVLRQEQFLDPEAFDKMLRTGPPSDIFVVTPSHWSAEAFYKAGFHPQQVLVVPHGADTDTFRPMLGVREAVRKKLALPDDDFVFLSVGSMTGNKGMDLLLRAFAEVSAKYPQTRLVLKGLDALYRSNTYLHESMQMLSPQDRERVESRITYLGGSFSNEGMAKLYHVADAYVSPYRAEGFNIPVLEAAASGLPIICTRGGPTDDFVTDAFARRIDSHKAQFVLQDREAFRLEPSLEHLIALMEAMIEDRSWREQVIAEGPSHVHANYNWDRIVQILTQKLFA
jgi:glycosyltransferase involved in cell wall biosynthesis